jgi:hypothetical protein
VFLLIVLMVRVQMVTLAVNYRMVLGVVVLILKQLAVPIINIVVQMDINAI